MLAVAQPSAGRAQDELSVHDLPTEAQSAGGGSPEAGRSRHPYPSPSVASVFFLWVRLRVYSNVYLHGTPVLRRDVLCLLTPYLGQGSGYSSQYHVTLLFISVVCVRHIIDLFTMRSHTESEITYYAMNR